LAKEGDVLHVVTGPSNWISLNIGKTSIFAKGGADSKSKSFFGRTGEILLSS